MNFIKIYNCQHFKTCIRFFSFVIRTSKPIVTQDERLINPEVPSELFGKSINQSNNLRRVKSFFDYYTDKSIEGLSFTDTRFGQLIVQARSTNDDNDLFVIENENIIRDLIKLKANMKYLYISKRDLLKFLPFISPASDAKVFHTTYKNMCLISNMSTPQGIIGIFERNDPNNIIDKESSLTKKMPLTLILDNIRDPGNLGTILRTAAGFNINKVLLTKGCVSIYNEKVIRSSLAVFLTFPVFKMDSWDEVRNALHPNVIVHAANIAKINTTTHKYYDDNVVDFSRNEDQPYALVIGGETEGISDDANRLVDNSNGVSLNIPIVNKVNSLNSSIAAAIILSEFQRRFLISVNKNV